MAPKPNKTPRQPKHNPNWHQTRRGRQDAIRARAHIVATTNNGREMSLPDDYSGFKKVTKDKSALAWVRVACSFNCVLAAATLYLQQVLAKIIRAWKWEDHADKVGWWTLGLETPPRTAIMMLQASWIGDKTMQSLSHRRQMFAARALREGQSSSSEVAALKAEVVENASADLMYEADQTHERICREILLPEVVRGHLAMVVESEGKVDSQYDHGDQWEAT